MKCGPETPNLLEPPKPYSKPQKVGNRIKVKQCWDSLYMTLKDWGYELSNFRASTVNSKPYTLNPEL